MSLEQPMNACRTCGATNYRQVIARDASGDLRPTGLYRCSGCSVVFADPKAWRDGGVDELDIRTPRMAPQRPIARATAEGRAATPTVLAGTSHPDHPVE